VPALHHPSVPEQDWGDGRFTPEFQPYSDGRRFTYVPVYNNTIWVNWAQTTTTATTSFNTMTTVASSTTMIWDNWNQTWFNQMPPSSYTTNGYTVGMQINAAPPETPEQAQTRRREQLARDREAMRLRRERDLVRAAADERAWATLEEMISDVQREQLRTERHIIIPVGNLAFYVLADHGSSGNVHVYEDGVQIARLCAHPQLYPDTSKPAIPQGDVVLSQVMAIITDPQNFIDTANVHHGRRPVLGQGAPVQRRVRAPRLDRALAA
jgi:hypothetical protein